METLLMYSVQGNHENTADLFCKWKPWENADLFCTGNHGNTADLLCIGEPWKLINLAKTDKNVVLDKTTLVPTPIWQSYN